MATIIPQGVRTIETMLGPTCDDCLQTRLNPQAYRCRSTIGIEPVADECQNVSPGKLLKSFSSTAFIRGSSARSTGLLRPRSMGRGTDLRIGPGGLERGAGPD